MADGPDDPKQKADKAWRWCERQWDRAPSPSQMVEAAVTASIEAALAEALAPVLERVARLEELAQFPTLMAENDALLQKMADAPCATCGGARFVCDCVGHWCKGRKGCPWGPPDAPPQCFGNNRKPCPDCSKPAASPEGTLQHNPGLGSVTMSTEQAAALLKSSKPAASMVTDLRGTIAPGTAISVDVGPGQNLSPAESEGEIACTRHGQYRCPACAAGMVEEAQPPSPAESKGNGQWRVGRKLGRTLYVGDKCMGMVDTPELAAAIVAAMNAPSRSASDPASPDCGNPRRCEHAKAEHAIGHGCTARLPDGSECECGWYPPAPAATQGIPQSGPQAPERVTLKRSWSVNLWQSTNDGFGTEYVRADVHAKACIDSRRLGEEYVRLLDERGDFTEGSRPWRCEKELEKARAALAAAERRIVDCRHEAMLEVLHEAENPSQTPIGSPGSIMSRARDIGLKAKKREHMITHDVVVARAEGREAGIREAAEVARAMRDADTGPSEYAQGARQGLRLAGGRILALLAKKPEVGT